MTFINRQILQSTGYSFKITRDGKEGVAFYKTFSHRLILMDISMLQMNGMEATAAIRQTGLKKKLIIG